jgi:dTDP-4-dehydrorhamnose reductase
MSRNRLVITGGSGLLALNWAYLMRSKWEVILITHLHSVALSGTRSYRMDLGNPRGVSHGIEELSPDLLVHAAAVTNVDRCETDPGQAHQVNAESAKIVAEASSSSGTQFIHISTDQLFGDSGSVFLETDRPQPLNEYGRSKLLAEQLVSEACPRALVLRTNFFCWGFAQRQSFSDWIIYNLRAGKSLTLYEDVFFSPILADELAQAAHELIERGSAGIFNVVGDERLSKYEFALRLADRFSLPRTLIKRSTLPRDGSIAARPRDMSLDNTKAKNALGRGLGTIRAYHDALYAQEISGRRLELFHAVQ